MSLRRRTPLKRSGGLKRKARLPRANAQRAAKRRADAFGPQAEWCRKAPCCACSSIGVVLSFGKAEAFAIQSDPHHVRSRGAGGTDKDCVPLCREHHQEVHRIGRDTFDAKHGISLRKVADAIHGSLTGEKGESE